MAVAQATNKPERRWAYFLCIFAREHEISIKAVIPDLSMRKHHISFVYEQDRDVRPGNSCIHNIEIKRR